MWIRAKLPLTNEEINFLKQFVLEMDVFPSSINNYYHIQLNFKYKDSIVSEEMIKVEEGLQNKVYDIGTTADDTILRGFYNGSLYFYLWVQSDSGRIMTNIKTAIKRIKKIREVNQKIETNYGIEYGEIDEIGFMEFISGAKNGERVVTI